MNKLILFLFLFLSCAPMENYNKIIIEYVDFEILTPIHINCNNFNDYFKNEIIRKKIYSKDDITEISSIIKELRTDTTEYKPDIRLKMLLLSKEKTDTLCMSDIGVIVNKKSMRISSRLLEFVTKLKSTQ